MKFSNYLFVKKKKKTMRVLSMHMRLSSWCGWCFVSSQYDDLVFVVVMRRLFMFRRFKRIKYIQSETINQINSHQYVIELEP